VVDDDRSVAVTLSTAEDITPSRVMLELPKYRRPDLRPVGIENRLKLVRQQA
jgi:hypothetical protein